MAVNSTVVKRSIVLRGHKTSVSIEDDFWSALKEVASERNKTLSAVVEAIDEERHSGSLSSAIRVFVVRHYRSLSRRDQTKT
jgi:predicted DNA-binding ribbon-helix-helix protein